MKAISPSDHEKLLNIIKRLAAEGALTKDIQYEISLLISCHDQHREQLSAESFSNTNPLNGGYAWHCVKRLLLQSEQVNTKGYRD
jgi:hypothetical protein